MMPGRAFTLEGHPDPERNGRHVVVKATCEGRPEFSGASGLGGGGGLLDSLAGRPSGFSARIVFQKADVPFRPERRMPDPKIGGTVTAWIDGAGSGESPEMDSVGRYKVLLPLDASGRGGGSASHWIRMAQPYVGKGYGQNFPLTPGAEVLLSFVDGNPDRPVIAGAVPNGETGGLINGSASNRAGVGTRGGSSLVFGNDPGSQSVALDSGSRRGSVSLSANSPTTALIEADKLTVFTGIDNELFGLGVGRHVGMEYEVTATTRILNSVKAAALDALAAEKHMSGEVKSGGGSGYNEGGGLGGDEGDSGGGGGSGGSGGGGDGGGSPFFALAKNAGTLALTGGGNLYAIGEALKYMFTAYNPLQVPHRHLVHLSADSNGSRGFLRSKTRESLSAIRVLSLLNNTLTSIGATTEAVVNAKDLEENMPDDKNDRTNKILAVATQEATDLRVVVSQLAALIGTAVFTPEGGGETRGVVVENSDSYTDIYGKSALSVSSNGPVVVESSGSQVGELSRTHPFHLSIPEHLTRRESSPESAGFGSNKAVLLRSELVKALAGCIIMGAKECVYSKALYSMQFQVGANAAPPPPAASPALTDPLLNASLERINQEKVNIDAEQLEQGMLFRTNSANVPVHVETTGPDSPIELIQGKGGATEGSLTLDGEGCSLKAGDSLSLTLGSGGGPSARLSQSEEAFLGLDPSKAVLQQADGSALSIEGGSIKCQSPAGATIEAGASSVEVTPASVVFKGTSLNVDGRIIRLC
jgi:hypothetical protein